MGSFGTGNGNGNSKANFRDFSFTYPTGDLDGPMFQAAVGGYHFDEVVLEIVKTDPNEQVIMKVVFKDVLISSHQVSGSAFGDRKAVTSVSINFASMESNSTQKTDKSALLLQHDLDSARMA